ncbi:hypothetical protein [Pseudomonas brassicacearum]|uniref:hypothetical protein n=1 Tax=Pseudomonas brassicacearum TaxID=930166 RepID=UPI00218221FD|nr:hypothetical protein [Pseudomonas brassicacearum]
MALTRSYKHTIVERAKRDPEFAKILRDEAATRFDAAIHKTPEEEAYLDACLEEDTGDGVLIRASLNDIARAKDMTQMDYDADWKQSNID